MSKPTPAKPLRKAKPSPELDLAIPANLPKSKASNPEVTNDHPKDPRFDQIRETSEQLRACGRLFLRGQVKLGMLLVALKKEFGIHRGQPKKNSPDSGNFLPWADVVKNETGYSRQSCDEFIRLYEATKLKLKTSKKLNLPAPAKKNAIVLFQSENALSLTDAQWLAVDAVIGSLTTGETQASLMQGLGIVPKAKPMPKGTKTTDEEDEEESAGQLAFIFFGTIASPLINARANPEYKKMLAAMPLHGDDEHPLSLTTMEAETRAFLADIEDAKQSHAKPAKGKTINI
jgi:hypothetical protein